MSLQDRINAIKNGGPVEIVTAPQLFPTPCHIVEKMIDYADIEPDHTILEPSAGTGAIVQALIDRGHAWEKIHIVEKDRHLCDLLTTKFKRVYSGDFLERESFELGGKFDRIIMNPPFKNGEDIKHIKHALTMLKPGGILVAICANGPRQGEQLQILADHWEALPPGTFKEAGTNVNAAMLVIRN